MLKQLIIKNFALIDSLDIEFYPGFSVITGETGAGKSIILGAIGLLLGQRADIKSIKSGASRCVIEAHFDLSNYDLHKYFVDNDIDYDTTDCIIRRELMSTGKSRAFVNDTPMALTALKELGEQLIDIHSQHQNLFLNKEDFQLNVVDTIAGDSKQVAEYQSEYKKYKNICKKLEEIKADITKAKDEEEFIRFQYNEIDEAKFHSDEQENLEQENETLSHAEEIKTALYNASNCLDNENKGIVSSLKDCLNTLLSITKVYPKSDTLTGRIESCYIELKDITEELNNDIERIDFNPSQLEENNNRLNLIYTLQQKHHVNTLAALLKIADTFHDKIQNIDNSDELVKELEKSKDTIKTQLEIKAKALTSLRTKAVRKIEEEMKSRLIMLGMPKIRFSVNLEKKTFGGDGADKVTFYFSANTSTQMQPISDVASGGEIARVMLSLKAMISGAVKLPTIIFDEIDTGVSGAIAEKMARIMQQMGASDRQVISITHLPQIAALGRTHYKVFKEETSDGTTSKMTILDKEQRINEIAQMLSGSQLTDAAISNAKELLNQI
jgi:DNA repair protein RecN (Recombination protein N)